VSDFSRLEVLFFHRSFTTAFDGCVLMRSGDEAFEERVGLVGFAVEFGMELAAMKKGCFGISMFRRVCPSGVWPLKPIAGFFELVAVSVVEL